LSIKPTPVAADPDDHLVTSSERIAAILNELCQHLVLIGVRVDTDGPLYNSLLVRLDPEQQLLYIDELNLFDNCPPLEIGTEVRIYASLRGIAIRFVMTIERILVEDHKQLYVGAYPSQVNYLQRRDVFRVALPKYERRSITLKHEESALELTARLTDLSVKGFCIGVLVGTFERSLLYSRFHYSGMELPDLKTALSGKARLVNLRPAAQLGITSAGFLLIDPDPNVERALMRAALYYQREARKQVE
jgi:flagellar brake protein